MSIQRQEFVHFATQPGSNVAALARRYGISRKTAHKWIARAREGGTDWAEDRSRRPARSPGRIDGAVEERLVALRREHPAWGPRKLRHLLARECGRERVPAPSTVAAVLRRNGLIEPSESPKHRPFIRFEHPEPNDLWQMDFKGPVCLSRRGQCHPLTVLDDHSRFSLAVQVLRHERGQLVRRVLERTFRLYGLPVRMLMDNGSCWGSRAQWTRLGAWLIRLGVGVVHGRPYHPQTQGKEERFHRTLKAEALRETYATLERCQQALDRFRQCYNHDRPHQALGMATPATRYRASERAYPERLPPIEYLADDTIRRVGRGGAISFGNRMFLVGRAFAGEPVALRATAREAVWAVYYCHQQITEIDERWPDFDKDDYT